VVVVCLCFDEPFWEEKSWSEALLKDDDEYLKEHEDSEEVYPRSRFDIEHILRTRQEIKRKIKSTNRSPNKILNRQPTTPSPPRRPYNLRHPEERIHAPHEKECHGRGYDDADDER